MIDKIEAIGIPKGSVAMSNSKQKDEELACLQHAIKIGRKGHGATKRFMKALDDSPIERDEDERPDFILKVKEDSKNLGFKYLGIEHFVIDQASERMRKNQGKITGRSIRRTNEICTIFDKYKDEILGDGDCVQEVGKDLTGVIARALEDKQNSSYSSFIRSFRYAVSRHLNKAEVYRAHVADQCKAAEEDVRLAFLMDVRTDFGNFYLNKPSGKKRRCLQGEMPMFEDVVDVLEGLGDRVDYAILVMNPLLVTNSPDVLVIDCSDVRRSLKRQMRPCYAFAGTEVAFEDGNRIAMDYSVQGTAHRTKGAIDITVDCSYRRASGEMILNAANVGSCIAWQARMSGKGYVSDFPVELMLARYGDSIAGWEVSDSDGDGRTINPVLRGYSAEEGDARVKRFVRRWEPALEESAGPQAGESDTNGHTERANI